MRRKQPLAVRLYFHAPLYELARLVGYEGLPLPEARERLKPLAKKHGKEVMERAAKEIVHVDRSAEPAVVRLTDEARRACWQLLGPPPERSTEEGGETSRTSKAS